jgi:hypothetical protein
MIEQRLIPAFATGRLDAPLQMDRSLNNII